jgi:hypothetical protein
VTPRRRGRPPVDDGDASQIVTITLPRKQYDRYCAEARRRDVSVPAVIRLALKKTTKK